jgi:transmembrane sensor
MIDNTNRIKVLFKLYLSNAISNDDYQELLLLLDVDAIPDSLSNQLKELWSQSANESIAPSDSVWDVKMQSLIQQLQHAPVIKLSPWFKINPKAIRWVAAAAVLFFVSTGIYYALKIKEVPAIAKNNMAKTDTAKGVLPGGNKAVLLLADGTSIILDSSSNGTIASQGTTKVIKLKTGQLVYRPADGKNDVILCNTLTTPRGGQYQVTLADGTVVWLNSGSSLRYPTVFAGAERRVEITGEAYFEVAKNPNQPFKVKINLASGQGGEVEVVGTHFNVNAYDDEPAVNTTLFEGSVKVNTATGTNFIKPGQQLQYNKLKQIKIENNADMEQVIAWKEGRFQFDNADINQVMRQLSRWYDIEVEFKGNITKHFGGTISRNVNILKVLQLLEATGEIHFKVNDKKIFILP